MQINLTGFLEDKTFEFMKELWKVIISAQEGIGGIPREVVEAKKLELKLKREQQQVLDSRIREKEKKDEGERYRSRERRVSRNDPSPR